MRHALHAQHGLRTALRDAHLIFLAHGDALGIQDRSGGKLAVRRLRALAVGHHGDRSLTVDHHAAGELLVDVIDVDGDAGRLALVRLEEADQLIGAVRHGPERNLLAVDVHRGLIGAAHSDDRMIGQRAAGRGLHQIMRFDADALLLQQTVDGHGISGHHGGFAVDVQRDGLARGQCERRHRHRGDRDRADGDTNATHFHEPLRCPSPCHIQPLS